MAINFEPLFQIFFLTANLRQSLSYYSRTVMKGRIVIHKIKSRRVAQRVGFATLRLPVKSRFFMFQMSVAK